MRQINLIKKIFSQLPQTQVCKSMLCFPVLTFFFCFGDFKIGTQRKSRLQFSFAFHLGNLIQSIYTFFLKNKKCLTVLSTIVLKLIIWWAYKVSVLIKIPIETHNKLQHNKMHRKCNLIQTRRHVSVGSFWIKKVQKFQAHVN